MAEVMTMHGRYVTHPYDEPCRSLCGRASRTMAKADGGGALVIEAVVVHTHECPYWRMGKRHGACICGALTLWQTHYEDAMQRVRP